MTTKVKLISLLLALTVAFASGRWLAPTKVITEVKTVEVEKKTDQKDSEANRDKHKETTTTEVVRPDGTKETTTTIVEDSTTHKKSSESDTSESTKTDESRKEVDREGSKVTVSALAGLQMTNLSSPPVYGGSVTKPILGPITIGFWGLTNSTIGGSIGISF